MNDLNIAHLQSLAIVIGTCTASGLISQNCEKIIDILGRYLPVKSDNRLLVDYPNTHRAEMKLD